QSHYETDALRWYWGDDNLRIRSRAVERPLDVMPMADQRKLPEWVIPIGNSRLILSASGSAFVVDAGYRKLLPELQRLHKAGRFRKLDGIWITHYHDDHTDYVNQVAQAFDCPVYFIDWMKDILENPSRYRMPCLTTEPIRNYPGRKDGEKLRWNEFEFTFLNFPGQTMYHGGLLARRYQGQAQNEALLFVGDSFTPSGMDDYCMQNRNIIREGAGYLYCLDKIASLKQDAWLINQHVEPMFQFSTDQLTRMKKELSERAAILRDLAPWPDPNYALDESWARVYPYGTETEPGKVVTLELRIFNHSPERETYSVNWHLPTGWKIVEAQREVAIPAQREGVARVRFRTGSNGLHIVTADVAFGGRRLPEWTEAMIRVR
ncbi:MAG: MBL fold metallo-hydrolase, partial [Bryobacteraceae bacterium]